jgi:hypothetical protein
LFFWPKNRKYPIIHPPTISAHDAGRGFEPLLFGKESPLKLNKPHANADTEEIHVDKKRS